MGSFASNAFFGTLTDAVSGAARLAKRKDRSPRETATSRHLPAPTSCDEQQRRARLLHAIYRARVVEVAGEEGDLVYPQTFPPDWWVNDRLESLGETWRIHNVDGFRFEVYDLT